MRAAGVIGAAVALFCGAAVAAPTVDYSACLEPFSYGNASYWGATTKDNGTTPWCYLKQITSGSTWGNVRPETIPIRRTTGGAACNATSVSGSETIHGCSTVGQTAAWCTSGSTRQNCDTSPSTPLPVHTQPVAGSALSRIALGSCFKTGPSQDAAMDRLTAQNPGLMLWVGDNIYGDTTNMTVLRGKYDAKKQVPAYQRLLAANIPVMATWDDHDFGANNAGSEYPMRTQSQQEFLRHFDVPASDVRYSSQAGVYSAKAFGSGSQRVSVILLDARYHRSPTFSSYGQCQGNSSTMLGTAQWDWLAAELEKSTDVTIIASGVQHLPPINRGRQIRSYCAYGNGTQFNAAIDSLGEAGQSGTEYESWAEVPQQREKLLRLVQSAVNRGKTKAVVFVSGDQHWAEIMRKTIPAHATYGAAVTVHELTASGFEQNWSARVSNPNRLPTYADTRGNGVFDKVCRFPFRYGGVDYHGCTTTGHTQPWCYWELDASGTGIPGQWGNCPVMGTETPVGRLAALSPNIADLTLNDYFLVNVAASNFGLIDIDWSRREIKLSIQTDVEEAVAQVVRF